MGQYVRVLHVLEAIMIFPAAYLETKTMCKALSYIYNYVLRFMIHHRNLKHALSFIIDNDLHMKILFVGSGNTGNIFIKK
jgi:hypothetical protein